MNGNGFFVLAGPQCSGKSTAKNYLYARYMVRGPQANNDGVPRPRNLVLLQEMRQIVMHERAIHSAIFIDAETEEEIIRRDLERLDDIRHSNNSRIYLDETSLFTLAHAQRQGLSVDEPFSLYREYLLSLHAEIFFLNASSSVSWTRRKPRYEERVLGFPPDQAAVVLRQYREHLDFVHKGLRELVNGLNVPVHQIEASGALEDTLGACADVFVAVAGKHGIELVPRF